MILPLLFAQTLGDAPLSVLALGGKQYLLSEPAYVASGVAMAQWSPDGSQLFALRADFPSPFGEPPKEAPKAKLLFYGVRQKKVLGEVALPGGRPEISWEGPSGSVIVSTDDAKPDGRNVPLLFRARPGQRLESLWVPGDNGYLAAMTSKSQAGVLMFYRAMEERTPLSQSYFWLAPNAQQGTSVGFPIEKGSVGIGEDWTVPVYGLGSPTEFYRFDPRVGFAALKERPVPKVEVAEATGGEAMARWEKKAVPLKSFWIYDTRLQELDSNAKPPKNAFALVVPKAEQGAFSEGSMAVFYIDEGNLFVRQLNPTTDAQIETLVARGEIAAISARGSRVGQALLGFLREHRGQMPGDLKELRLSERDREGVEWTYKGPADAGLVADPAATEVARIVSPRGVCSIMLSGKAVWVFGQ